jgi:hypothetical protein
MTITTVPANADLLFPRPEAGKIPSHLMHSHYFGFNVPEAALGAFIYLRWQPAFNITSGGVCIFQGLNNLRPLDCEHCNFLVTMPYVEVQGNVIEANGLRIEFTDPGKSITLKYQSPDGSTRFELLQTALTPMLPRGHVMPGEDRDADPLNQPGGCEQFVHCTGTVDIDGQSWAIDCTPVRGRSWSQVRTEDEVPFPPVGWSPMYLGPDLCFNQVGYEAHSEVPWAGIFDVDLSRPGHYFGSILRHGELRQVPEIQRRALKYHPDLYAATEQEILVVDDRGDKYRIHGEAIAMAQLPSWPNNIFVDSVYRWRDDEGRETYGAYQESWYHRYQRHMRKRRG